MTYYLFTVELRPDGPKYCILQNSTDSEVVGYLFTCRDKYTCITLTAVIYILLHKFCLLVFRFSVHHHNDRGEYMHVSF